jgi:hypothetical protein
MKTGRLSVFLFVALLVGVLASCSTHNNTPEYIGTWSQTTSGETVSFMITATSVTVSASGILVGTMDWSIQAIDETAKHIQMSQTSSTGAYTVLNPTPNGTIYYMTYSVSGNSILLSARTTGYPASATAGPYIKQ